MRLLKRLRFALKYDIEPDFRVMPFGNDYVASQFTRYEDAVAFAEKEAYEKPQFGKPSVMVIIHD